jgi:hypothetical protein
MGVGLRMIDLLLREVEANWQSLRPQDDPSVTADARARFLGAWREHREVYGYTLLAELPDLLREALRDHDEVLLPKHSLATAFCEQTRDLLKQSRILKQQNEKLRAARGLLLAPDERGSGGVVQAALCFALIA